MKKLFVALLAVAGLTACFNEEVVNVADQRTPIAFDSFVDKATRSEDPSTTTESLDGFDVWGFMNEVEGKVFENEDVTKPNGVWTYTNTQYWTPGNKYYFAAVAPMNSANVVVDTTEANKLGLGVIGFTNVDGTEDLLYSAVGPIEAPALGATTAQKVQFQFNHLLSKVRFSFTNGFNNDLAYIKVTNIRMEVPQTAELAVNTADWWVGDKWTKHAGNIVLEFGDMENLEVHMTEKTYSAYERLTIPAAATKSYNVTFDVELYMGTVLAYSNTMTTTIEGVALQMGKAYNFHATINHENITPDGTELLPIEFDVIEVKNWETEVEYDGGVIETKNYATALAETLAAGGEVTLSQDVALTEPLVVPAGVNATINLNGFDITGTGDVFEVAGGTLTINGDGEIYAATDNGEPYCAVWAYGNAVVNINGGTYKVGYPTGDYNDLIYAKDSAVINIHGGEFYNSGKENSFVLNVKDGSAADINVYGGAFEKFNPANNNSEGANTNFVADGLCATQLGDWYYVGDIRLTEDITLSGDELNVASGNNVNLDLNGKTLTVSALDPIKNNGKMTIANGKVVANYGENTRRCIYNYGEMTINGVEFVQTYDQKGAAINNEGKMIINDATVNAVFYSIWNSGANAELTINGGTYTTTNNVDLRDTWAYAVLCRNGAKMTINGGSFVGNHGAIAAIYWSAGFLGFAEINWKGAAKSVAIASVLYVIMFGVNLVGQSCGIESMNYFYSYKPEGNSLLELFWSFIPVRGLYLALPCVVIAAIWTSFVNMCAKLVRYIKK